MKLDKVMNIFFYIFNIISISCFLGMLLNIGIPNIFVMIILIFYIFTYYSHNKLRRYILETYYIERDRKDTTTDFIERTLASIGHKDYKENIKVDNEINIEDYSEDQIKQALKFCYYNK